jgi:hypothetical protein
MKSDTPFAARFPSPISGFCVTDTSPSAQSITLRSREAESSLRGLLDPDRPVLPGPTLVPEVRLLLKEELINAIVSEDYAFGSQLESAAALLRASNTVNHERRLDGERSLSARLEGARRELQAEQGQWLTAITEFQAEQQRLRQEMQARHAAEQIAYEEKWRGAAALIPYTKPSPELLDRRKVQKELALARRFGEAAQLKGEVAAMQAAEAKGGEERAMAAVHAGFAALVERQRRELDCFNEHERRNIAYVEQERTKAVTPLAMLIRALENAAGRTAEEQAGRRERRGRPQPTVVITPRARTRLKDFRIYDEPERLDLDGQAIRRFVATKRRKIGEHSGGMGE